MHSVKSLSSPLGHFVHVVDTHQDDRDNTDDDNYDYMAVKANFRMPTLQRSARSSPDLHGTERGKVFAGAGQPHAVHSIVIKNIVLPRPPFHTVTLPWFPRRSPFTVIGLHRLLVDSISRP